MGNGPVGFRVTHTNVDFVVDIIRPILTDQHTVGDQLNRRTNTGNICAQHGGFGEVDVNLPLDTRYRRRIVDASQTRQARHIVMQAHCFPGQNLQVITDNLDLDILAYGRAVLHFVDLGPHPGNLGNRPAIGFFDAAAIHIALAAIGDLNKHIAYPVCCRATTGAAADTTTASSSVDTLVVALRQYPRLNITDNVAQLCRRKVAFGRHIDPGKGGIHVGKKLGTVVGNAIPAHNAEQHQPRNAHHHKRVVGGKGQDSGVGPQWTTQFTEAPLVDFAVDTVSLRIRPHLTDQGTQDRGKQ